MHGIADPSQGGFFEIHLSGSQIRFYRIHLTTRVPCCSQPQLSHLFAYPMAQSVFSWFQPLFFLVHRRVLLFCALVFFLVSALMNCAMAHELLSTLIFSTYVNHSSLPMIFISVKFVPVQSRLFLLSVFVSVSVSVFRQCCSTVIFSHGFTKSTSKTRKEERVL